MAQDPFERFRQIQARAQSRFSTEAPKEDPFEKYKRLRDKAAGRTAEEPTFLEGLGATALGVPAAVNTVVASTLGKISRVPTLGRDNPVSKFFTDVETGGRELFRPADKRLSSAYETSEMIGRVPGEIAKYMAAGGPVGSAALGAAEAVGARPEESEAAFAAKIAGKLGATRVQRAMTKASETVGGRALTSTVLSAVPDVVMQGVSKAAGAYRARAPRAGAPAPAQVKATAQTAEQAATTAPPVTATTTPPSTEGLPPLQLPEKALEPTTMAAATKRKQPLIQPQEVDGYVNFDRFSADPAVQDRLKAATSKFVSEVETPLRVTREDKAKGLYPGKKVGSLINSESFDEVRRKVATDLGVAPEELVERSLKGERLDRVDLLRVRTAVNDVLAEEDAILKELDSRSVPDDQRGKLEFRLSQLETERNSLLDTFTTQRQGTARDLNALKITALRTADPVTWMARAQRLAQRPLSDAERKLITDAAAVKDLDALNQIANDLTKATWRDKFNALYKSNLLSAPRTFAANMLGNATMAGLEAAKDYPAVFFDTILGAWTKTHVKSVGALDPRNMAKVSYIGAKNGADDFMRTMRGKRPSTINADLPREVNFDDKALKAINPFLNWYTRTVGRGLSGTDMFFKNVAVARSLDEQARVIAKAEKRSGEAFQQRVDELLAKPTDEMSMRAASDAEFATFQENSKLARGATGVAKFLGPVGDILIPFSRTPANIAKRIYEYSPLGALSQLKRLSNVLLKRDASEQRELVDALGRISVGSGAMALGYSLAAEGRMTGFFPPNQRERDAWEEQGKLEGAVKMDEKSPWVQINKYSPFGNLMQIGAQMYALQNDTKAGFAEKAYGTVTAPIKSVSELPMVSQAKDFTEALQRAGSAEGGEAALRVVGRSTAGLLPFSGLLRSVTGGVDPLARETKSPDAVESIKNQVINTIPFQSRTLPPKVDPLGAISKRPFGVLGSLTIPSQVRDDLTQKDFVRKELERTGAVVGRIKRAGEETGEQYASREIKTGTAIRNALAAVIARDPTYRRLGQMDATRARAVLTAYNQSLTPNERIDLSRISDDRIRARLQGQYLEQKAEQLKDQITKATNRGRKRLPSAIQSAVEAIVR